MTQNKAQSLLVVVDMQNCLLEREPFDKDTLLHNVSRIVCAYRKLQIPTVFLRHTNKTFAQRDTEGGHLSPALAVGEGDRVIDKTCSNPFDQPEFVDFLSQNHFRHLIVCGLVTNGCVQATCTEALKQGYVVTLVSDGHSTWVNHAPAVIADWNQKLEAMGAHLVSTEQALLLRA